MSELSANLVDSGRSPKAVWNTILAVSSRPGLTLKPERDPMS